jgi:hypothetical protein
MPSGLRAQQPFQVGLPNRQRRLAQILATFGKKAQNCTYSSCWREMQGIEIGNAIDAKQDGLAIEHKLLLADFPHGLDDLWIAVESGARANCECGGMKMDPAFLGRRGHQTISPEAPRE